jgi:hypothetical protein
MTKEQRQKERQEYAAASKAYLQKVKAIRKKYRAIEKGPQATPAKETKQVTPNPQENGNS